MTVYDYIRQRWPEQAQRIIECAMKVDGEYDLVREVEDFTHDGALDVLQGLFIWSATTEGHEYWKALSEQGERVNG